MTDRPAPGETDTSAKERDQRLSPSSLDREVLEAIAAVSAERERKAITARMRAGKRRAKALREQAQRASRQRPDASA